MKVLVLPVGPLKANCYTVCQEETGDCVVIDPGGDRELLLHSLEEHRLTPKAILLTHGHFDHIGAVDDLKKRTGAKLVIHPEDVGLLQDPDRNLSRPFGIGDLQVKATPDRLLKDEDMLEIGGIRFRVLHAPGHTMGGVFYIGDGILFSGDTLMQGTAGRTDMPGGNLQMLMKSLSRLSDLDDSVVICPGHGPQSTLARERISNPYLQAAGGPEKS